MANQEQLAILRQGVDIWNKWREENPKIGIDLSRTDPFDASLVGADLNGADLRRANLSEVYLRGAYLRKADLNGANLRGTDLSGADLSGADLGGGDLSGAILFRSDLSGANLIDVSLCRAYLRGTRLERADLRGANLQAAYLFGAYLEEARLEEIDLRGANLVEIGLNGADLSGAHAGEDTIFGNMDFSKTIGLEAVLHDGPSTIGTGTLQLSKGKIPDAFLRGCGLSDFEIEWARLYNPDLSNQEINDILYKIYDLRARQAIQVSPLFISYSHADAAFVDRLEIGLNEKGVRFWRDIHAATAGRLEKQIEQAIRHNPTVLVVLSKNSTQSDWVEHEVRTARGLERELKRDVLCPVALDDSWKTCPWPERVMEQVKEYNILDFSKWEDEKIFEQMFVKLLDGLQLFYRK